MFQTNEIAALFILSIPVACIAWTFTHEEIFSEVKNFCTDKCKNSQSVLKRKFFYLFTCEYCFSHYVTALMLIITKYHLLFDDDWRGYLISGFSMVWIANIYMSLYAKIRIDLKVDRLEADTVEEDKKDKT